jgi:type IV pilus assembly protein PilP
VRSKILISAFLALGLLLGGCSDSGSSRTRPQPAKAKKAEKQATKVKKISLPAVDPNYRYDPAGKPDPFRSFVKTFLTRQKEESPTTPLERFDLSQLRVTAIVWGMEQPKALIEDPSGKGYIVAEGAAIGKNKGRIVSIDDNLVLVKETYVDFSGKASTKDIEMRLHLSQGG